MAPGQGEASIAMTRIRSGSCGHNFGHKRVTTRRHSPSPPQAQVVGISRKVDPTSRGRNRRTCKV